MTNDVTKIVAKIFSISESEINDQSGPETIESWDSFNGLVLVDELENHFKVKFTISEITDVKNVADIKRHLKNHNVELDD
jgi:acyl carrier protein